MTEKISPRPNIAQLEDLLNQTDEGEIEVLPNGDVVRLSVTELLEKNLKLEQGRNELLRKECERLREVLKQIQELSK